MDIFAVKWVELVIVTYRIRFIMLQMYYKHIIHVLPKEKRLVYGNVPSKRLKKLILKHGLLF
jgi:hypothetical protein